jgi:hypothetical protein
VVSERLGHAHIQLTLDTYSHVLPTLQEAAATKMDALFIDNSKANGTASAPQKIAELGVS